MRDMIKERRDAEKKEERDDLFSSLLDASEAEADAQLKLSDSELVGKVSTLPLLHQFACSCPAQETSTSSSLLVRYVSLSRHSCAIG